MNFSNILSIFLIVSIQLSSLGLSDTLIGTADPILEFETTKHASSNSQRTTSKFSEGISKTAASILENATQDEANKESYIFLDKRKIRNKISTKSKAGFV